ALLDLTSRDLKKGGRHHTRRDLVPLHTAWCRMLWRSRTIAWSRRRGRMSGVSRVLRIGDEEVYSLSPKGQLMLHFGTSLIRTTIRGAIRVAALLLIVAGAAGGQEPEEQPPLERPPVQLPPSTTVAEARRAASPHSYWRGVNATTGCARGLTLHECASVERAITRLLRHEEPFCRAMGERVRERIAQG